VQLGLGLELLAPTRCCLALLVPQGYNLHLEGVRVLGRCTQVVA